MKSYAFYEMIDQQCQSEEFFYDIWYFCSYNDCSIETIIENDMKHLFQITGMVNSVAAIVYGQVIVEKETHDFYFDMYEDVGKSIGKMVRVSFNYTKVNPMKIKEIEVQFDK